MPCFSCRSPGVPTTQPTRAYSFGISGLKCFSVSFFLPFFAHFPFWNTFTRRSNQLTSRSSAAVAVFSDVTSDRSLMYLSIYDRGLNGEEFIGRVEVKPVLVHDHTVDRWYPCVISFNDSALSACAHSLNWFLLHVLVCRFGCHSLTRWLDASATHIPSFLPRR